MKKLFIILICGLFLVGCSDTNNEDDKMVSYLEAKEQIINHGAVLMDVRTEEEYNAKHIDGAVLLSLDTISEETVADVVDSKETVIIVYCKSGNRSRQALEQLETLGYTEVYDLGSISNWEE